jgi:gliding motility-associated lipoprotein GldH
MLFKSIKENLQIILKQRLGLLFGLLIMLVVSCKTDRVYEENKTIPDSSWDQNKKVNFSFTINDTVSLHNMYINIRNGGNYAFSNLFLFMETKTPQGQISRDTVECILAAPDGKWLGEGLGDIRNNRILFKKGIRFPQTGVYQVEFEQAMRVNPLPLIMDIGIRIEKEK